MIVFPFVGGVALVATAIIDGGAVARGILFGLAAVAFAVSAFGDQNRLVFFGRRWSIKGEPELSDAGYGMARLGWIVLAVLVVILGVVDVSSQL